MYIFVKILVRDYLAMMVTPASKTVAKRQRKVFSIVDPLSITVLAMVSTALL